MRNIHATNANLTFSGDDMMGTEANNASITPFHFGVAFIGFGVGFCVGIVAIIALLFLSKNNETTKMFRLVDTEHVVSEVREARQACLASQGTLSAKMDSLANGFSSVKLASAPPEKAEKLEKPEKGENNVNPALKQDAIDFTQMSVQLYYAPAKTQKAFEIRQLLEKHHASVALDPRERGGERLLPNRIYPKNLSSEPQRRQGAKKSKTCRMFRPHPGGERSDTGNLLFFLCVFAPLRFKLPFPGLFPRQCLWPCCERYEAIFDKLGN